MFGGDNKDETRNLILAAVLSMAVVFAWYALFPPPEAPVDQPVAEGDTTGGAPSVAGGTSGADGLAVAMDRDAALARFDRVPIVSDVVTGSIALTGGRLDDLHLEEYRETLDEGSDTVVLLNPTAGPSPYYAVYGWLPTQGSQAGDLPGANTPWEVEDGSSLTPESPVTLAWDNGSGLIFRRTYALDERYMFSITQSVENTTEEAVSLAPYAYLARRGRPETTPFFILHEGVVAMTDGTLTEMGYSDLEELAPNLLEGGRAQAVSVSENGWLGFTDKYWMTTLIPAAGQSFDAVYKTIDAAGPAGQIEYRTEMRLPVATVEPGANASVESKLFAGAKELRTIRDYEDTLGIVNFIDSIDWGWFYFLTKPIASLLIWVQGYIGNMGFSIIILTLIVKTVLFPLAYKSYVAMSRMKKLQPEMEKIKERAGEDRTKLQQEMMALYKKEKVNPAAGCLPILVQIPIFFALYKVLFVTIEMRHAPFILWIDDLSAPDPTSWINLFGILPYDVSWAPEIISIGVFPVLMGITMWMQQRLNPAPTDPTQQMIFAWMPWMFMFMLGSFASGLVIYWTANNVLTFAQQYLIMRSQGVEVDFFGNVKASFKRLVKKEAAAPPGSAAAVPAQDVVDDDTRDGDTGGGDTAERRKGDAQDDAADGTVEGAGDGPRDSGDDATDGGRDESGNGRRGKGRQGGGGKARGRRRR
ncbi:MAG: membrane protein insertase YidC [Pseudomonadota bacterium]